MNLREISFGNFKSLYNTSFEPGKVNVFIGANGSGKSTVLEAIGLLSAAMTDRVDDISLQRRGVRLSAPALYRSRFRDKTGTRPTIDLSLKWEEDDGSGLFQYDVHLAPPKDESYWKYHSETFLQNGEKKWGRSNASQNMGNDHIGFFLIDGSPELVNGRQIAKHFSDYGIFQPNTMTLRGTVPDPVQTSVIGLNGGRLAEALEEIIKTDKDGNIRFGSLYMEDILEMIEWASDIVVNIPNKTRVNSSVPVTRQIIEFSDRFMKDTARFTGYDASEGALYILFMLCLAMHPKAPAVFAIDSFDHALNPRLARKITKVFCQQIKHHKKHVFLTTHNPLVLDGLDLNDPDIRLFAVDRGKYGHSQIHRIQISEKLVKEGQALSRLWIGGRLGGVPELL